MGAGKLLLACFSILAGILGLVFSGILLGSCGTCGDDSANCLTNTPPAGYPNPCNDMPSAPASFQSCQGATSATTGLPCYFCLDNVGVHFVLYEPGDEACIEQPFRDDMPVAVLCVNSCLQSGARGSCL